MKSLITAFSMYSKIPMPEIEWNEKNMKYVFLFFPLVGALIGGLLLLLFLISSKLQIPSLTFAAFAVAFPVALTGGIHIDGLLDTSDALASYGDAEKKRKILKDPHVGAFGVIKCCVYIVTQLGLWCLLYEKPEFLFFALSSYIFSRIMSGYAAMTLSYKKNNGLLNTFSEAANKILIVIILRIMMIVGFVIMLYFNWILTVTTSLILYINWCLFKKMVVREFETISGDLTGYFLQRSEWLILAVAAIGGCFV